MKRANIAKAACTLTLILIAALALTACAPTGNVVANQNEPIKIGALLILSGVGADWGEPTLNGIQLAVKEINAQGGINGRTLELVVEDNPSDGVSNGIAAYRSLHNRGVDIIVGPSWSVTGQALAPIACEDGTLLISPTIGVPDFAAACNTTFNVYSVDTVQSAALGHELARHGRQRLAILGANIDWYNAQALAVHDAFIQSGGSVVFDERTPQDTTDFSGSIVKIIAEKPDVVFVLPYIAYEARAIQQLRDVGYTGLIVTAYADDGIVKAAPAAFEGAILPTAVTPISAFREKYRAGYGKETAIGADTGYDAVMLIANAMRSSGKTDAANVARALSDVKTYKGMSGNLTFDADGGVSKETAYQTVKNGTLVPYAWN